MITRRTAFFALAAVAAAALAGCSSAEPEPAPAPAPPAPRVVVEANVDRYVDAVEQLSSQPACCAAVPTQQELDSGQVVDRGRENKEDYGRQYCEAIIRGVPVEGVVMDVFGANVARLQFAQDSARLAGEILCPMP